MAWRDCESLNGFGSHVVMVVQRPLRQRLSSWCRARFERMVGPTPTGNPRLEWSRGSQATYILYKFFSVFSCIVRLITFDAIVIGAKSAEAFFMVVLLQTIFCIHVCFVIQFDKILSSWIISILAVVVEKPAVNPPPHVQSRGAPEFSRRSADFAAVARSATVGWAAHRNEFLSSKVLIMFSHLAFWRVWFS